MKKILVLMVLFLTINSIVFSKNFDWKLAGLGYVGGELNVQLPSIDDEDSEEVKKEKLENGSYYSGSIPASLMIAFDLPIFAWEFMSLDIRTGYQFKPIMSEYFILFNHAWHSVFNLSFKLPSKSKMDAHLKTGIITNVNFAGHVKGSAETEYRDFPKYEASLEALWNVFEVELRFPVNKKTYIPISMGLTYNFSANPTQSFGLYLGSGIGTNM